MDLKASPDARGYGEIHTYTCSPPPGPLPSLGETTKFAVSKFRYFQYRDPTDRSIHVSLEGEIEKLNRPENEVIREALHILGKLPKDLKRQARRDLRYFANFLIYRAILINAIG